MFKKKVSEHEVYESLKQAISINDGALITLGQLLYFAAKTYPDNSALISGQNTITYKHLFFYASQFAKTLTTKGIKPRDRVLLFFENSIEFYVGYYAIVQIGAVVAPLNTFLKEAELKHIIADAQPTLLVASTTLLKRLEESHITTQIPILTQEDMQIHASFDETQLQPVAAHLDSDEMAALLYTSGTTGLPKGVMLSSKNILTNTIQGIARMGFVKNERVLGVLPFFHSFAQCTCVWAPFVVGCTVIIVPKIDRRYILEGLMHSPTIFLGVPALFGLLCLMKKAHLDTVKYFISGGDAMPDKIRAGFELIYGRKIASGYGLSETSPVLTADLDDDAQPTNNVGKPIIGVEIQIRDDQGTVLDSESIGQIWARGDNVMLGYYNEPEKTEQVIINGWFDTGDLGYINKEGKLIITGRLKDVIAHKGFKIYPQEIENVILQHPNVIQVGVIGEIDENVGEIPVAYVQIRKEQDDIEQRLRELCERNLASYKVPRKFICSTAILATTATGKVDKKVLRKKQT